MQRYEDVQSFWDWLEFYPDEDEEGYNGQTGIKGLKPNAPDEVKAAYAAYMEEQQKLESEGIKA